MTRNEVIAKVQKLRALASSTNLNEAANAAAAAERLLQEHALSEAEITTSDDEPMGEESVHVCRGQNIVRWQSWLLAILAKAYNVSGYWGWSTGRRSYQVVGRPSDVATVRYQFAYFVTEISRLRAKLGKGQGKTWGNSFYLGAVKALETALSKTQAEVRAQHTGNALAVIDSRREAALALKEKLHPDLKSMGKSISSVDIDAYNAGLRAGSNLAPRTALAGSAGPRLLK